MTSLKSISTMMVVTLLSIVSLIFGNLSSNLVASVVVGFIMFEVLSTFIKQNNTLTKIFRDGNIKPVPWRFPIIGNVYHVFLANNYCKLLLNYHKKMGKHLGFLFGPNLHVATTDLDLINQVYIRESNIHVNLMDLRLPNLYYYRDSLMQIKDDKWRRSRRAINPSFSSKQIKGTHEAHNREESCQKFIHYVSSQPVESGARVIDVQNDFAALFMDGIMRLAVERDDVIDLSSGGKGNELVEKAHSALEHIIDWRVALSTTFEALQTLVAYTCKFTRINLLHNHLVRILDESFERRKKQLNLSDKMSASLASALKDNHRLIDTMMSWKHDLKMKDISAKAHFHFIFFAGFETTGNALTIMFWFLAQNQEVQEHLRQAVAEQGEEASYMDWCIQETLRLYPSVPCTARVLAEDVITPGGYKLIKGTTLIANIYSIHHSEEYWGQDVEEFRPERFAEPLGHQHQFFGFGGGNRACLGKNFALHYIKTITSKLILQYQIAPDSSTPTEIAWNARNVMHMQIDGPINLKFIERKNQNQLV